MAARNWKGDLQQYCQLNHIPLPKYSAFKSGNKWIASVDVNGLEAKGVASIRKVDSEQDCARILLGAFTVADHHPHENINELFPEHEIIPDLLEVPVYPTSSVGRPTGMTPQQMANTMRGEMSFLNNPFNPALIEHLQRVVRGKHVDITMSPDYRSMDAVVVFHICERKDNLILSSWRGLSVDIYVPNIPGKESYQAMMLLSMCMELGSPTCSVIDASLSAGHIDRVVLSSE